MIAATALAADLPMLTRNLRDFQVLEELLEIIEV
jgi:predicted nucleic acid-binding protein